MTTPALKAGVNALQRAELLGYTPEETVAVVFDAMADVPKANVSKSLRDLPVGGAVLLAGKTSTEASRWIWRIANEPGCQAKTFRSRTLAAGVQITRIA